MFSFFSSRQRQHQRTMATLNQITLDAAERMQQDADRANRRAENAREEMAEDQHSSYMRAVAENAVLREVLAKRDQELLEQRDLVAYWANGNEVYRRTIQHLCQFWAPQESPQSSEQTRADQVNTLVQSKTDEVLSDQTWVTTRNNKNEARVAKRRKPAQGA